MKGLKAVAKASQKITQRDKSTWLPIYYCIETDTVYAKPGEGRCYVTDMIRENTEEDIVEAVERWKRM